MATQSKGKKTEVDREADVDGVSQIISDAMIDLKSSDRKVRSTALWNLCNHDDGRPAIRQALIGVLRDKERINRLTAAQYLSTRPGGESDLPLILQAYREVISDPQTEHDVLGFALGTLPSLGPSEMEVAKEVSDLICMPSVTYSNKCHAIDWLNYFIKLSPNIRPLLFRAASEGGNFRSAKSLLASFAMPGIDTEQLAFELNKFQDYNAFETHLVGRGIDVERFVVPDEGTSDTKPVLHDDYDSIRHELVNDSNVFREKLAARLAPALNARIQSMPRETLEQKQALAAWVNDQLEPLGLAVRCPKTNLPAKLRGVTGSSNWPDVGRYCFQVTRDGKAAKTAYSVDLPILTLMDATPPEITWQQTVGSIETRTDRGRT